ncbi:MAG: hypothetical protein DYG89_16280 [Caldilinea sp. CFX5]|nr:hypothetical protein [Caldilinea sp. CFX5]
MRRTIWLLAIAPLIVFYALLTQLIAPVTPSVQAADPHRPLLNHALRADQVVVMANALVNAVNQEVGVRAPVVLTSTVVPTPPRSTVVLPRLTPTASPTVALSETAALSLTAALSKPVTVSNQLVTNTAVITTAPATTVTTAVTTAATATATTDLTVTQPVTAETAALDAEYAGPVEGTIIANRTEANVRFFVEGATYNLAPLRSIGLSLPRVTAVLNLFNCDANLPETQEGCFWDPYLLDRDQFYEVVNSQGANLALQAAGTPPDNQIWLQNRTGKREQIFYAGATYELPPAGVQELTTEPDTPAILYLRSCLEADGRAVCEWAPNDAEPGIYYALVEVATVGAVANSQEKALQLQPIVADGSAVVAEAPPAQVTCQLLVPVLNVRSGPGLQYQIISKIRSDQQTASVTVTGRDADAQWLAVSDRVAPGGWIAGTSGFVNCEGSVNTLPVAEVTDGRLAPTPVAAPATGDNTAVTTDGNDTPPGETEQGEAAPVAEATPTTAAQTAPPGQALLVIHNGFDQQIRFTLDQRYRVAIGPSEFDLQPGESISLLVYPGMIAFSASSPWRGLSGNDDFMLEAEQTLDLWITFVPDPDGSGNWILQF